MRLDNQSYPAKTRTCDKTIPKRITSIKPIVKQIRWIICCRLACGLCTPHISSLTPSGRAWWTNTLCLPLAAAHKNCPCQGLQGSSSRGHTVQVSQDPTSLDPIPDKLHLLEYPLISLLSSTRRTRRHSNRARIRGTRWTPGSSCDWRRGGCGAVVKQLDCTCSTVSLKCVSKINPLEDALLASACICYPR
jgi:hypothetical protein